MAYRFACAVLLVLSASGGAALARQPVAANPVQVSGQGPEQVQVVRPHPAHRGYSMTKPFIDADGLLPNGVFASDGVNDP